MMTEVFLRDGREAASRPATEAVRLVDDVVCLLADRAPLVPVAEITAALRARGHAVSDAGVAATLRDEIETWGDTSPVGRALLDGGPVYGLRRRVRPRLEQLPLGLGRGDECTRSERRLNLREGARAD
jgi:hypothetical protein